MWSLISYIATDIEGVFHCLSFSSTCKKMTFEWDAGSDLQVTFWFSCSSKIRRVAIKIYGGVRVQKIQWEKKKEKGEKNKCVQAWGRSAGWSIGKIGGGTIRRKEESKEK